MANWNIPLYIKRSVTAGVRPASLADGELFINQVDGVLCSPNSAGGGTFRTTSLAPSGGSMVYPSVGIAQSTGSAWGTSLTTSGTGTVLVLATGGATTNQSLTTPNITAATYGAGTASAAPFKLTAGTNLTTAAAGAMEYDGTVFYLTPAASSRAIVVADQYCCQLNAGYTLTAQTTAQKLFNTSTNGALTLAPGTYEFECEFALTGLSATSGTVAFGFGGTGTFNHVWSALTMRAAALTTPTAALMSYNALLAQGASMVITAASTATTMTAKIRGAIRVTAAGTIIPQVTTSVAAAAVVQIGSKFRCWAVGNTTVQTVGNWS